MVHIKRHKTLFKFNAVKVPRLITGWLIRRPGMDLKTQALRLPASSQRGAALLIPDGWHHPVRRLRCGAFKAASRRRTSQLSVRNGERKRACALFSFYPFGFSPTPPCTVRPWASPPADKRRFPAGREASRRLFPDAPERLTQKKKKTERETPRFGSVFGFEPMQFWNKHNSSVLGGAGVCVSVAWLLAAEKRSERAQQSWQWAPRSRSACRAPTTEPSKVSAGFLAFITACLHPGARATTCAPGGPDHSPLSPSIPDPPPKGGRGASFLCVFLFCDGTRRVVVMLTCGVDCLSFSVSLTLRVWPVELQVKRPLMPVHLSPEQVGLEMLCLCEQLDLLVRAQMQQVRRTDKQTNTHTQTQTHTGQTADLLP